MSEVQRGNTASRVSSEVADFPSVGLRFETGNRGLFVSQAGRTYLARRWRLTSPVMEVIETALEFGLCHLWQEGHPSKDESHHISFSFSKAPSSWVFVIGGEAAPPELRFVTFNKRYRGYFKDAGFGWAWDWETGSGKNILIRPADLRAILSALPLSEIREGRLPTYDAFVRTLGHSRYAGTEAELESVIHSMLVGTGRFEAVQRQRSFPANEAGQRSARADLIAVTGRAAVVVEIKPGLVVEADTAQAIRYLGNIAIRRAFADRALHAALIGSAISSDALALAERHGIAFYEYRERDGVTLNLVGGQDWLHETSLLSRD
jgi:hypothetical protein